MGARAGETPAPRPKRQTECAYYLGVSFHCPPVLPLVERKSAVGGESWERKECGGWELRSVVLRRRAEFRSTSFPEWNGRFNCRGVEVLSAKLAKVAGEDTPDFPYRKFAWLASRLACRDQRQRQRQRVGRGAQRARIGEDG